MFKFRKKQEQPKVYVPRPREYDREERIAIQKIVSSIPVTRKMLSQDLLVTALNNFIAKNIKIGSTSAQRVNTTKHPQVFFESFKALVDSTKELQKIEPYWRFEGHTPTEQLKDLEERKDRIIRGFINDSFNDLVQQLESKGSPSQKQKLFDGYQNVLIANMDVCGEGNFEFFKTLCREKLNIIEETSTENNAEEK
ncbi:MAG: hypothetical protein KIG53_05570 [Oscillospiraceae bacterium]|nr:hypothetical protein [Oscillospiraceae bacterium]